MSIISDISSDSNFAIAVHGGAGTISQKGTLLEVMEIKKEIALALMEGYRCVQNGGSAIDGVQSCVEILEDCPRFNAGKGSVFNSQDKHFLCASIMCGQSFRAGAVCELTNIKNPIRLARKIMDHHPDSLLLCAEGAQEFAKGFHDIEFVENDYFDTDYRRDTVEIFRKPILGTVGAVALDTNGFLASATSTGGRENTPPGRISDTAIIGAGTYANNLSCAISATGYGEYFIKSVSSYDVSARMVYGNRNLQTAMSETLTQMATLREDPGGLIGIDHQGNICLSYRCAGMYRGYIKSDGIPHVAIWDDMEEIEIQ